MQQALCLWLLLDEARPAGPAMQTTAAGAFTNLAGRRCASACCHIEVKLAVQAAATGSLCNFVFFGLQH